MWLRFPDGTERISVAQQNFEVEARDDEGHGYGRVPNPLAPQLLSLGFKPDEPPKGAPDDLPVADPLRDGAIADLTRQNSSLRGDVTDLRSSLTAANAKISALTTERNSLEERVHTLEARNAELEEDKEE